MVSPRGNAAERQMKIEEAIALANRVKAKHRQPLDKLQRSTSTADVSAGTTALRKSYDVMGNSLSGMTAQLSKIAVDVVLLENHPHAPWRLN
jgi:hypothetical protein